MKNETKNEIIAALEAYMQQYSISANEIAKKQVLTAVISAICAQEKLLYR